MPEAAQSLTGVSEDVVAQDDKRPATLCTHTPKHTHTKTSIINPTLNDPS